MLGKSLNHSPTLNRLVDLFRDQLNLDVASVDTDLFETGVLDSLAFVNLLVHLEKAFEVTVSPEDLEVDNFRTIAMIATFVEAERRPPPAAAEANLPHPVPVAS